MQYFFLWLLSLPFIFFNYKIVKTDLKEKRIPNKYLLYLLWIVPFYYIYTFLYIDNINYLFFVLQIFLTLLISFTLYYFWIRSAWDAKYLLVLWIFIPQIWIVPFISNIALVVIFYLLVYYIYFYVWKCLFSYKYAKFLYKNIFIDLKDKFVVFIKHPDWNTTLYQSIKIIINWLLIFLFIFVSLRLLRMIIVDDFFSNRPNMSFISDLMKRYFVYVWMFTFFIFWIFRFVLKKIFIIIRDFLLKIFGIKHDKTKLLFPIILFSILILFIYIEYIKNPYEISKYLYKIFTLYITLFIIIRILIYTYKATFQIAETFFLKIEQLEKWEIVDKDYLTKLFWEQWCLWAFWNENWIFSPDPKIFFTNIENPIDTKTCEKLKEIFTLTNNYHTENNTANFQKIEKIKVLMTFSFSPYILLWFIMSLFYNDSIFSFIVSAIIRFIMKTIS